MEKIQTKISDLILGRMLKAVYLKLGQKARKEMENVFNSGNKEEKEEFIKKNIKSFKKYMATEAKKLEAEIKARIS